jgi:hypothetical protein
MLDADSAAQPGQPFWDSASTMYTVAQKGAPGQVRMNPTAVGSPVYIV